MTQHGSSGGSAETDLDYDALVKTLLDLKYVKQVEGRPESFTEPQLDILCNDAMKIIEAQSMLLELDAPMRVCGDIHGQYYDLMRLFEYGGDPKDMNYLFLGDYVDRGKNSIETVALLFAYKVQNPENFFLLRGNHECSNINKIYGFFDECKRRFSVKLWKTFSDVFNFLPVSARIADRILCMHGGLSPALTDLHLIRDLPRPTEVPEQGLLCDLLWSDPGEHAHPWGENDRGISFTFSADYVWSFLRRHDLDLIAGSSIMRGH